MLNDYKKELTQDQWERYWKGELAKDELFTEAEIWGYGVYLGRAYEDNGKYILPYSMGSSCD